MFAIGEASRRSGVAVETIRYYEREGITAKPGRTASGRRAYTEAEIAALRFIKHCRDLGFSIPDAVSLRRLANEPATTCADAGQIGRAHLADVRAKLAELKRLEGALAELVANCDRGERLCPMLDTLMGEPQQAPPLPRR